MAADTKWILQNSTTLQLNTTHKKKYVRIRSVSLNLGKYIYVTIYVYVHKYEGK